MKFKKFVSGMLACAMVVTSVFTGNVATAKAEGPAARTVTPEDALGTYSFDGALGDGVVLWKQGMVAYDGTEVYEQGKSDFPEDKAVRTQAKYGLKLPQTNLGSDYTLSFWVKSNVSKITTNHNVLTLGKHSPEKWMGLAGNNNNTALKLWSKADEGSVTYSHTTFATPTFPQGEWKMVTLAQSGTNLSFYINGKLQTLSNVSKGVAEVLNGEGLGIYLAANYWDPTVDVSFDDVSVYNKKLDATHIYASYLDQMPFKNFGALAEGDSEDCVSKNLNLPETYDGMALTWTSKNPDKIDNDGTIKVLDGSDVLLTASGTLEGGAAWSHDYKVRLAKPITVEYVKKGETTPLKTKEVAYKLADSYTYTPTNEDKVWTHTDGKTYVLSEEEGDNTLTTSGDTPKFVLTYNEDVVTEIVTEVPDMVTRIGVRPAFPETVTAKFSSGATRENIKVDWSSVTEDVYATAGEKEVVGKVGAVELKIKLTVKDKADYLIADYSFDKGGDGLKDGVAESERAATKHGDVAIEEGLKGNAAYFPGGEHGTNYIELPDELLKAPGSEENAKDITISLFSKKNENVDSFAMSLLSKTEDVPNGNPPQQGTNYLGLINNRGLRAEVRTNGGGMTSAAAESASADGEWLHFAVVLSSTDHKLSLYKNGVLCNTTTGDGVDIANYTAEDLKNYLGYSPWPADSDYNGAIDEFKVYNTILTQGEIQSICDETMYDGQMKKTKDALATLKTVDDVEVGEDTAVVDDLQLPTQGAGYGSAITWTSSNTDVIEVDADNGEGLVTQPTDADAEVTLTAVVKIGTYEKTETLTYTVNVPKREGVDKSALRRAIRNARKILDAATAEGIYNAESLGTLETAIEDATAKLDDAAMTDEQVAEEVAKLNAAAAAKFQLKDLEELEDVLTAWYPFDTDAKDKSFMHADAEPADTVKFSKANGATIAGPDTKKDALKNIIKLPVDKLKITDRMTFSMQVYSEIAGRNIFGIGSVVSETGNIAKQFYLSNHFNAYVTNKGYAGGAHKGYGGLDFAANTWHDVTVVIDGKKITLYLDGEKKESVSTDVTMTDAWNYDNGSTRFAYIGNCAYGHNGDADFKGSIKDVRIYNAALTEEQVGYIDEYRSNLNMVYAKEELVKKMSDLGAVAQDDGTYTLNVTQREAVDGKLALPTTCFGQTVKWTSDNAAITIGETDTSVTLPASGADDVIVNLKATITIDEKTEEVTYKCTLFTRNMDVDTSALKTYIDEVKGKEKDNYAADSWTAYLTALNEAVNEEARPTSEATVAAKKTALEAAVEGLVDISELRATITQIQREKNSLDENLYTSASWEALQGKLDAAKAVLEKANATKQEVKDAIDSLPEKAVDDLTECGDRTALNAAIEAAEALEAYKDQYTDATWSALETALATAKEEQAKRLASYDAATAALQAKIDALEVKPEFILSGDKKTEMQNKLNAAKAEAEERVEANYTAASWDAYQKALDALDKILKQDKATIAAANDALAALEAATAALTPVSAQEPTSAVKKSLADAIAGANTNRTYYTTESWAGYQAALDKLTALKTALDTADSEEKTTNITKYEIEKAIEALDTAAGQLVPTEEHAVGDAERAEMEAAIAEAGTFRKTYYTNESWTVFQEKLNTLKAMQNSTSVTKEEVKAATKDLEDAMSGLVPTDAQKPDADKIAELNTAFENATTANAGMKESDYTAESWEAYQNAYAAMKKVADRLADDAKKGSVTKTEIQTALDNMKTATDGLKRNVDKTALNAAIEGCASLKATDYTTETWNAFQTALNAAKTVAAKEDATQAEVDAALAELNAKKGALARPAAASPVLVNSIKLSATYKNVAAGKKTTVKATVNTNATDKGVTFASSNSKWATVNAKTGVVTTKKAGAGKTVTITATANDAGKKKQTIKIKIMKNAVTKVTVKKKSLSVKAGKKVTIKATVKTNGSKANKTLSWKSSNTKWATVSNKGKVTTKKAGKGKTVKITVTSTDGTNKKATVKIKITK